MNLMDLVQLHKLEWPEDAHRLCLQSAFLVRIGRLSEHAAIRHLLFSGSAQS